MTGFQDSCLPLFLQFATIMSSAPDGLAGREARAWSDTGAALARSYDRQAFWCPSQFKPVPTAPCLSFHRRPH